MLKTVILQWIYNYNHNQTIEQNYKYWLWLNRTNFYWKCISQWVGNSGFLFPSTSVWRLQEELSGRVPGGWQISDSLSCRRRFVTGGGYKGEQVLQQIYFRKWERIFMKTGPLKTWSRGHAPENVSMSHQGYAKSMSYWIDLTFHSSKLGSRNL